jgi:tripartite-type tricarboxylate transporter receptor subunit TctC
MAGCGRTRIALALAAALALLATSPVRAAYPERPITLIVPFAPGGPTDIIARILATALHASLGQAVIIDNRAGAAGNTGMGVAARAAPDGYTLLLTSTSIAVNPALFKNLPYDPFKDFIPISELVNAPNVIVVRPDSGINSLADLVAQAKAAPTKFNYSSPGAGTKSHLTGEMLKLRAGIQMVHVPYRGAGPATLGVLAPRRADHGRARISELRLRHLQRTVRAGGDAARDRGTARERKPCRFREAGGPRAGPQGRLRDRCRPAGSARRARRRRGAGGARPRRQGRHQGGVSRTRSLG